MSNRSDSSTMHQSTAPVTMDEADAILIPPIHRSLQPLTDQIESINERHKSMNDRAAQIRQKIIERYKIRNNYYHRKFPLLLRDMHLTLSNFQSLQRSTKVQQQLTQVYQGLSHASTSTSMSKNLEYYQEQLHQTTLDLHRLKQDVCQCESELDRLKADIVQKTDRIGILSKDLFHIQFDQQEIRLKIAQVKEMIRFEKRVYDESKQQILCPDDPLLSLSMVLWSEQSDGKEDEQRVIDLQQELDNLKESHQKQWKALDDESNDLLSQIKKVQMEIEQTSVALAPLKEQIIAYETALESKKLLSHQPMADHTPLSEPMTKEGKKKTNHFDVTVLCAIIASQFD